MTVNAADVDVSTQEVLVRTHDTYTAAPGSKPLRDISTICTDLQAHEVKKAQRRIMQMRTAREKLKAKSDAEGPKRKLDTPEAEPSKRARLSTAEQDSPNEWTAPVTPESTMHSQILLRIHPEMRGHTSYLTFATLAPKHIRDFLAGRTQDATPDDKTETEFADPDLDNKLGTMTEEEMMAAMMA